MPAGTYDGENGHNAAQPPAGGPIPRSLEDRKPSKGVAVAYKECLKNHAAAIGGNATDGCGEFMPNGEEGTLEALKCSACNCHRNFHRKEIQTQIQGDQCFSECHHCPLLLNGNVGSSSQGCPTSTLTSSRVAAPPDGPHPVIMSYKSGSLIPSESDEKDEKTKKRFRTKFTKEQKEKMLSLAEKAGWRIQKLEESDVKHFCQELGIKRRVLMVWMHNNKHNFAKKMSAD